MNGELKVLRTDDYNPSYDVESLHSYDFDVLSLIKLEIESELHILAKRLEANNADMSTPLVTADGFPRSDINVLEVRTIRVKIIKLRNDLKVLLEELGNQLSTRFQEASNRQSTGGANASLVPFAIVTEVLALSPAHRSGLRMHDKIATFGDINASNHNDLRNIAHLVKNKENEPLEVLIVRNDRTLSISLTPTTEWPGQGLLGCRLNLM